MSPDLTRLLEERAVAEPHPCGGCGRATKNVELCFGCRRALRNGTARWYEGPCRCGETCGRPGRGISRLSLQCYRRLRSRSNKRSRAIRVLTGVRMPGDQVAAVLKRLAPATAEQVAAIRAAVGVFEGLASGRVRLAKIPPPARAHTGRLTVAL